MKRILLLGFVAAALAVAAPEYARGAQLNLFSSDYSTGSIYEYTPNATRTTFATALNRPIGLAVDSAGNLFEANDIAGTILKFAPDGTHTTFATGLGQPQGLAFDSTGNLFVVDESVDGNPAIYKYTPSGTRSVFSNRGSIEDDYAPAFDSAGNLWVTNVFTGSLEKYSPSGLESSGGSGFVAPRSLAFDSTGNLFVVQVGNPDGNHYTNGSIVKITPSGTRTTFASSLQTPSALAFDSAGNLYSNEAGDGTINGRPPSIVEFAPNGTRSTFYSGGDGAQGVFFAFNAVPEPGTAVLLTIGGAISGFALLLRRRRG